MYSRKISLTILLFTLGFAVTGDLPAAENSGNGNLGRVLPARGHPAPEVLPSDMISRDHMQRYQELAVRWMQEYLRLDTTNPPGHEQLAAEWFQKIFDAEGIENRVLPYAPGRANIWARVPAANYAGQKRRPIILLNHMDVVTADPSHWLFPPFSGKLQDGVMYGRGAQDMKSEGLAQLMTLVMLKRERPAMNRDVIFLGTADEEARDTGTDWLIANHRELLANAEYLLTEGGDNLREEGKLSYVGVDVAEKAPLWLHIVAHGESGHASRPIENSAPNRLVRALNRILAYQPELKPLPQVAILRSFSGHAGQDGPHGLNSSIKGTEPMEVSESYLLRDTISVTMLGGSRQTNVIPDEAWANLDARLVPGEDPRTFLEALRKIVNDSDVTMEPIDGFVEGNSSPIDTPLFAAIQRVGARYFAGAPVEPHIAGGYNESQRYRPLGIVCYGFSPYTTTPEEANTAHGNNERIRVEELQNGFRVLYDVLLSAQ